MTARDDVCLVLEGTYPYVPGGVSSWVHTILTRLPQRAFSLLHIGPYPDAYGEPRYHVPNNVTGMTEMYCSAGPASIGRVPPVRPSRKSERPMQHIIDALRRLHLEDQVDDRLLADLASADLSVSDFLHGAESFDLLRDDLYPQLAGDTSFTDFFWHMRAMHVPLLRLLSAKVAESGLYHSASCGYAGVVAAIAGVRTGRPVVLTEHGIYARERELELTQTPWIHDPGQSDRAGTPFQTSPLRRIWTHYFTMLSRLAYHQAERLITLSDVNRDRQIADGADPGKIEIIPNGVDCEILAPASRSPRRTSRPRPLRIGFIGRVVPIKDVLTLIRAVHLAHEQIDVELWVVGPKDEDPAYATRCHELVEMLELENVITFLGRQNIEEIYPEIDLVLLTSISEGQPLVILEAFAAGVPVVASDVGACRELIMGAPGNDAELGPAGVVTRVANPTETADALVLLARDHSLRQAMGKAGLARVNKLYQLDQVIARYDQIYGDMLTP